MTAVRGGDQWSEQERDILCEKYKLGWNDQQISEVLPGRSEKAVQTKRRDLKLTSRQFPNRPKPDRHSRGRLYSAAEDEDILARYKNGEAPSDICPDYNVSTRAMEAKIDRMLNGGVSKPIEPSGRFCLWCGRWFISKLPPKLNRRCPDCKSAGD